MMRTTSSLKGSDKVKSSLQSRAFPVIGTALFTLMAACSDKPERVGFTDPPVPTTGSVFIRITSTGADMDLDGYQIVVDGGTRRLVAVNSTNLVDASPGSRSIALERVAANCQVTSSNPLSVTVVAGSRVDAAFTVECVATGVEVSTRTSGVDIPVGFEVAVDGFRSGAISPNGSLVVSRLTQGPHGIALKFLPGHCAAAGGPVVASNVVNGKVTRIVFDIQCTTLERKDKIAYVRSYPDLYYSEIVLVSPNGAETVDLAYGQEPAWAPDRRRIAFSTVECDFYYGCAGGLAIMDADTRIVTSPRNGELASTPAWSPDGNEIVFVRSPTLHGNRRQIHVMASDGSTIERIDIPGTLDVRDPSWSPDGKRIALTCQFLPITTEICVINRDGSGLVRISSDPASMSEPAWSPDGTRLAVAVANQIALMAPNGSGVIRIADGTSPHWSGDGRKLVFRRTTGVFTMNADGSSVRQITTGGNHDAPVWRP